MKLNGKTNIITDHDITITDKQLGDSLSSVLGKHKESIDTLQRNVKWLYKHGGVGSGSGGGGGSTKWTLTCSLGNNVITGDTIVLSQQTTTHPLEIRVTGSTNTFNVIYSYGDIERSATLSAENNWRFKTNIELSVNGTIKCEVTDNIEIKTVSAQYIVTPYTFSDIQLVDNNAQSYGNDILISKAASNGLKLISTYIISVDAEILYQWSFNDEPAETQVIENTQGSLEFQVPSELFKNDNAGFYKASLTINITPKNQNPETKIFHKNFNLIPEGLYLKITPNDPTQSFYDNEVDNPYVYNIYSYVGLQCRVYNGAESLGKEVSIEVWSGDNKLSEYYGKSSDVFAVSFKCPTTGWSAITFKYSYGTQKSEITKYFYAQQIGADFTWYREGTVLSNLFGLIDDDSNWLLQMAAHSNNTEYRLNGPEATADNLGWVANFCIQYYYINDTSQSICTLKGKGDELKLYQNKVEWSGETANLFIPKTKIYDQKASANYHTVTIVHNKLNPGENDPYYQTCVYLDGVLEGNFALFKGYTDIFNSITFHPGIYCINSFDISYINDNLYSDLDALYYHTTYLAKCGLEIKNEQLLSSFIEKGITIENNHIIISNDQINTIAENVSVPVMEFVIKDTLKIDNVETSVLEYINHTGAEDATDDVKIPIEQVNWSPKTKEVQQIPLNVNEQFYFSIQGSSTTRYKSKNFTFGLQSTDASVTNGLLFSPNYNPENTNTFLPEQRFTLKADMTDSSHSNNTSIGAFINTVCGTDNTNMPNYSDSGVNVTNHIRQCLEGFPILLLLTVKSKTESGDNVTKTYYLGIYNFNLGRDSYYNLGYYDIEEYRTLSSLLPEKESDLFTIIRLNSAIPSVHEGFVCAEVQANKDYYDFSQFHESVLFPMVNETPGGNYMFGDIVRHQDNLDYQTDIIDFVKSIAFAGGFVFTTIGKDLRNVHDNNLNCYQIPDIVPDYRCQVKRETVGDKYVKTEEEIADATTSHLTAAVLGENEGQVLPTLHLTSGVNYYTIAMIFGLVDSVIKNLNIKSWDSHQFGLFYYDMDTSLGRDNDNNEIPYFAFSDFWKTASIPNEDGSEKLLPTVLYRDYKPNSEDLGGTGQWGYDFPSSYLFAIIKYAQAIHKNTEPTQILDFPQQRYAEWRTNNGPLSSADKFIDTYFQANLKDIPDVLVSLNYREKYLYDIVRNEYSDKSAFSTGNSLTGRRVEKTRDWLNGRLHILDAYFNIMGTDSVIYQDETTGTSITEPKHKVTGLIDNPDIYVLHDIFSGNETTNRQGTCDFKIKTEQFSPLVIRHGSDYTPYIINDPNSQYNIAVTYNGSIVSGFGGSALWTEVETMDPFIKTNSGVFYCHSEKLQSINGSDGTMTNGAILNLPFATTVSLTGKNYKGPFDVTNDNLPSLTTLDVSNSQFNLTVSNHTNLNTLIANNLTGGSIDISAAVSLKSVSLSGTLSKLTLNPIYWLKTGDTLDLSNVRAEEMVITFNGAQNKFAIRNNSKVKTITVKGAVSVSIDNCSSLKKLDIDSAATQISVTNCKMLDTLDMYATNSFAELNVNGCISLTNIICNDYSSTDCGNWKKLDIANSSVASFNGYQENNDYVLDLTRLINLTYIDAGNNSNVAVIKFTGSNKVPLTKPFTNCNKLKYITGNVHIACTACFKNAKSFSLKGGSNLQMTCQADITEGFAYTSCTLADYAWFAQEDKGARNCTMLFAWPQHTDGVFGTDKPITAAHFPSAATNLTGYFYKTSNQDDPYLVLPADLFSKQVTHMGTFPLYGYNYICSTKLFDNTSVKQLGYFWPYLFYEYDDDHVINNGCTLEELQNTFTSWMADKPTNFGKASALLNGLELEDYRSSTNDTPCVEGILNNVLYIDYNDLVLQGEVSQINKCFTSTYATGTIDIQTILGKYKSILNQINNSFRVGAKYNNEGGATLHLTESTFAGFTELINVGIGVSRNGAVTDPMLASFNGDGITKTIENKAAITNLCGLNKTNLQSVVGLFMDGSFTTPIGELQLPGVSTFEGCTNLSNISALFYNLKHKYTLLGGCFTDCSNLTNVSYLFGARRSNANWYLEGSIPSKLFYTGDVTATKTYKGSDTEPEENDGTYTWTDLTTVEVSYETSRKGITNISYCFSHCNCDPYVCPLPEGENINENTVDGIPAYIQTENGYIEKSALPRSTIKWVYDGVNGNIFEDTGDVSVYQEGLCQPGKKSYWTSDSDLTSVGNYLCPPDLLRYCVSNANVEGLFANSGFYGWGVSGIGDTGQNDFTQTGLKGRICPYLLEPVSQTTSLKNMFLECKLISCYNKYETEDDVTHTTILIPENFFTYVPKVTNLEGMFKDTIFPATVKLNVFDSLKGVLNIQEIFAYCYWENQTFSQIFKNNSVSCTTKAFYCRDGISDGRDYPIQTMTFSDMFKGYNKPIYATNKYEYTFANYQNVTHENPRTLYNDNNYYTLTIN